MLVDQSKTTGQVFSREQFPLGGGGHLERVDGLVLEPHPEQHRRLYGGEGHRVGLCQTVNSLCQTAQGSCQTAHSCPARTAHASVQDSSVQRQRSETDAVP